MEGQLIIHGKPTEGELLSTVMFDGLEDRIYNDFFGSSAKPTVSPCYIFEIRLWKNTVYSVYSYYNNGKDKYGRGNGYCTISLIIKENFTSEYGRIMSTLHKVYTATLKEDLNIIDESGQYLVSSLRDSIGLPQLGRIYQDTVNKFQWVPISPSYSTSKSYDSYSRLNIDDATEPRVDDIMKREGIIYISPEFLSISETLRRRNERFKRDDMPIERSEDIPRPNINDDDRSDNNMLVARIDRAKAEIIRNVEILLSNYLPADKAGNFQDLDSESSATRGSNSFSFVKFANRVTLVNCGLLLVCIFLTCRGNNSFGSDDYIGVADDSINVEMATISKNQLDSIKHERDSLRNIVNVFNQNQWPKIDVDGIDQKQPYLAKEKRNLSIVFNETYPKEELLGTFKILKGDAAKIEKNTIIPQKSGTVTIGYVQQDAILSIRDIEIKY